MIPQTISFAGGVSFNPDDFIHPRRLLGPIPTDWSRVRFESTHPVALLDRWLANNIDGRWASYALRIGTKSFLIVAFERLQDAVMFRLREGETAFHQDEAPT